MCAMVKTRYIYIYRYMVYGHGPIWESLSWVCSYENVLMTMAHKVPHPDISPTPTLLKAPSSCALKMRLSGPHLFALAECWCWYKLDAHMCVYIERERDIMFYWFVNQLNICCIMLYRFKNQLEIIWYINIPVVLHKAVAEDSKIGEASCCDAWMAERIHWWTERWLELCCLGWLQWLQWSPHRQLLDVVWRSAVVVVVVV